MTPNRADLTDLRRIRERYRVQAADARGAAGDLAHIPSLHQTYMERAAECDRMVAALDAVLGDYPEPDL